MGAWGAVEREEGERRHWGEEGRGKPNAKGEEVAIWNFLFKKKEGDVLDSGEVAVAVGKK